MSDADKAGRGLFSQWCREAGCSVGLDAVGNLFARRPGRNAAAPAVLTGSHLDTQPNGGRFDGAYGMLAGLEVIRMLNDARAETAAPIEVAVWSNEEGTRFAPSMVGSMAHTGALDRDRDDFRALRRRHQPQRNRKCDAYRTGRRLSGVARRHARDGPRVTAGIDRQVARGHTIFNVIDTSTAAL